MVNMANRACITVVESTGPSAYTVHAHTLTNNLSLLEKGDPSVVSVGGS